MPANLVQRPENCIGFPATTGTGLLHDFKDPPPGYGEIPFYWWTGGDTLTKERLLWQLDKLAETSVLGFNVSYNHTHRLADPDLNRGNEKIPYGVPEPSIPGFMTDEWWDLWNWYSEECAERDMGLGLDDYVLGWPGAGFWADRVEEQLLEEEFHGTLILHEKIPAEFDKRIEIPVPETCISLRAYPVSGGNYNYKEGIDLIPEVRDSILVWEAPDNRIWDLIMISSGKGYMLHPDHGKSLVQEYYQVFEDHLSTEGIKGMNFFFQDELHIPVNRSVWSEDFAGVFKEHKGYDIRIYLPALFYDIGEITPKVRLDYYDVMIELLERRYFKPVFEWHWQRGKLFGCDNQGRGLQPSYYGDYFRATRWFSAPGNDAPNPSNGFSFIQTKVSSSVAHLYKRPRTWLEAFHSLGWNATLSEINFSTYKHYQFGANLLCLHGLYYTTHGGWWEWAPPDFHFRMPYWPHFKDWLRATERLSFICSQGNHVCDLAILYPVAPLQAGHEGTSHEAFRTGEILFNRGLDFDFIDFQSLNRAELSQGNIRVSGENYRILILADMIAIRFASLQKALEHFNNGGVVVGVGGLPSASDRKGSDDPEIDRILKKIFAVNAREASQLTSPTVHKEQGVGIYIPTAEEEIADLISEHIERDFDPEGGKGSVMHRKIGDHDLFMVMDVPQNTRCHFRATGIPFLLDPETGDFRELRILSNSEKGTSLLLPNEETNLILFSPGTAVKQESEPEVHSYRERIIPGEWESEFVPTMDNQWGDFRLPASEDTIGVEARFFWYKMSDKRDRMLISERIQNNWELVFNSFGPGFWVMHTGNEEGDLVLDDVIKDKSVIKVGDKTLTWKQYDYSLREGVRDNPGSQGYHGLKGKVSDDFLILDKEGTYFFKTYVHADRAKQVEICISGHQPDAVYINGIASDGKSASLLPGYNRLIITFKNVFPGPFNDGRHPVDQRPRSAVVLMDIGSKMVAREPLAMRWSGQEAVYNTDVFKGEQKFGYYRFEAPPGLQSIECRAYGKINAFLNGKSLRVETLPEDKNEEYTDYEIHLDEPITGNPEICLEVEHHPGYYGGRSFPHPLKLNCGKGSIPSGDWSGMGVLKNYSGGLWYRKKIILEKQDLKAKVFIDLGDVVASAEVHVNGRKAGTCLKKPFRIEITDFVKEGDNKLEILVYSTLANHYYTIPTPVEYKKTFTAGLIGPVRILSAK